jgi:hypothetical protein
MKLKSFGCSHIFGNDLPDCPVIPKQGQHSRLTWPALIAQHLNLDYECYAHAGVGNLYIAEQILAEAYKEPGLFVINWTYIDRFDYVHPATNGWTTIRPSLTDRVSDTYYRQFQSEYRDKLTTLMQMKLCADTLNQNNIPFIMSYTDSLIFDQSWHINPATSALQAALKNIVFEFDNRNFINYAKENGHPVSAHDHVLESGHRACADYVIAWYKQNKGALAQLVPF